MLSSALQEVDTAAHNIQENCSRKPRDENTAETLMMHNTIESLTAYCTILRTTNCQLITIILAQMSNWQQIMKPSYIISCNTTAAVTAVKWNIRERPAALFCFTQRVDDNHAVNYSRDAAFLPLHQIGEFADSFHLTSLRWLHAMNANEDLAGHSFRS